MSSEIVSISFQNIESIIDKNQFFIVDNFVDNFKEYKLLSEKLTSKNVFKIKNAEADKKLLTVAEIINFFLDKGISKSDLIIVIGGGVASDIGGLVASLLFRGVNWQVIPTTLLAMIDASIGGKTGVNTIHGKNTIGSFHQPQKIYLNTEFLKTLLVSDYQSGLGELVKYALLDQKIEEAILAEEDFNKIILLCAQYKQSIVEQDPFETKDIRKILNLGHTIGHAIEFSNSLDHGIAVLIGIEKIHKAFGYEDVIKQVNVLKEKLKIQLPEIKLSDDWKNFINVDKKRSGENIAIVLIENRAPVLKTIPLKDFKNKL